MRPEQHHVKKYLAHYATAIQEALDGARNPATLRCYCQFFSWLGALVAARTRMARRARHGRGADTRRCRWRDSLPARDKQCDEPLLRQVSGVRAAAPPVITIPLARAVF